jgi:DNA-directed RNA polymerase subunit beta
MSHKHTVLPQKRFGKFQESRIAVPDLLEHQTSSYIDFIQNRLPVVIQEFSPIEDYSKKKFTLSFVNFEVVPPSIDEYYAREMKKSYEAELRLRVKLLNKATGETIEQDISLSEIPWMTPHGTFIFSGVERVIVPQLSRSYGIFIHDTESKKGRFFGAKVIPARGMWIQMDIEHDGALWARVDGGKKFPATYFLRVLGLETNEAILAASDDSNYQALVKATLVHDDCKTTADAFVELYSKLRDGEYAAADNAKSYIEESLGAGRYNFSRVGRFQINKRFGHPIDEKSIAGMHLTSQDIVDTIGELARRQTDPDATADDIDHLAMRRVRFVGEMLEQQIRRGMLQVRRNTQDKMSTVDSDRVLPIQILNQRPLQARIREFFATNQLSQFMEQENILNEIEHTRTISALGPGGLTRERAGFEVRDIHPSQYGRVCPIQTPEGPNIGLILRLSIYARINNLGIIETPYMRVEKGKLTGEVVYLNAFEEEQYNIAHFSVSVDKDEKIVPANVEVRIQGEPRIVPRAQVQMIDISTNQTLSIAAALIPFLDMDDAKRTLMGANMQKQATPLVNPENPLVATGMESDAVLHTGRLIVAREAGKVSYVDAKKIIVEHKKGETTYNLISYSRTNDNSIFHHTPKVQKGDSVAVSDVLADGSSSRGGQLALGQNVRMAFMLWRGHNYEDAIIISERLLRNNKFASIRIEEYECIVRDTKLGPEQLTSDIPNVSESKLRYLDENGIIRVGSEVFENDILVGKITPKGETELSPEERLLRSLFGDKAREIKDTSLRLDYGRRGRVIGVRVFSREKGDDLENGILKKVYIEVATMRHVQAGDKLAGRHGNKGVVSIVLPEADMPYTADGEPVDIVLTPMGVPGRMNLGQVMEMHLGLAANTLGYQAVIPAFCGATEDEVKAELERAGFDRSGTIEVFDGRTGEKFDQKIAVGYMHILKLHHMVDDKMHARSIGPYSLITQQPLGGKSQSGGQRFGEMEVWGLEGYGAAYTLREMLTIKSDDIQGRTDAFEAIIRGGEITQSYVPASFKVLLSYLRGLAFNVDLGRDDVMVDGKGGNNIIVEDELVEDIADPVIPDELPSDIVAA